MEEVFLGEAIRKRRKELKLTQEEVCEGICEPVTMSRLENGKQTPSRNTIVAILERLGMPDDRYFALLTKAEFDIEVMTKRLRNATIKYERVDESEKTESWNNVRELSDELMGMLDKNDKLSYQVLLHIKLIGSMRLERLNEEVFRSKLLEAIRVTIPRFDVNLINRFRYTSEEIQILCMLADSYLESDPKKTVMIYSELYDYTKKNSIKISKYSALMTMILHDYALSLRKLEDYEMSMRIIEEGRKLAVEMGEYQCLPGYYAMMAENLFSLKRIRDSKLWYKKAYIIYEAYEDKTNLHMLQKEIVENLKISIDELVY